MCQEVWPDESLPNLYFVVVNFGFQYLVPLSIILIFYMLLMLKIWHRKIPVFHTACRRETSTDTVDQWNARIVEQSKMKVLKMLIVIVSLFALSWLPLYLIFLYIKFGTYDENSFFGKCNYLGACICVRALMFFSNVFCFVFSNRQSSHWHYAARSMAGCIQFLCQSDPVLFLQCQVPNLPKKGDHP